MGLANLEMSEEIEEKLALRRRTDEAKRAAESRERFQEKLKAREDSLVDEESGVRDIQKDLV